MKSHQSPSESGKQHTLIIFVHIRARRTSCFSGHWAWNGYCCVRWFVTGDRGPDNGRMHGWTVQRVSNMDSIWGIITASRIVCCCFCVNARACVCVCVNKQWSVCLCVKDMKGCVLVFVSACLSAGGEHGTGSPGSGCAGGLFPAAPL